MQAHEFEAKVSRELEEVALLVTKQLCIAEAIANKMRAERIEFNRVTYNVPCLENLDLVLPWCFGACSLIEWGSGNPSLEAYRPTCLPLVAKSAVTSLRREPWLSPTLS